MKFVPTTGETRFTSLASGEIDLLVRTSTWTYSRDTDLKFDFVGVNYYDGQGFMVKKDLGVTSAKELEGATICIQTGTTTELNLADFFKTNNMTYTPVNVADDAEAQRQYIAGACDAYTTDASGLAASRATLPDAENHIILPEIISKEPLGPLVRHGDNNWGDIVRWTFYALVAAEEYGITSANVKDIGASTTNPEIKRLLGVEGRIRCDDGPRQRMGQARHRRRRQLWRDLRREHRRGHPDRPRTRTERAVDPGRPAVRTALPVI